MKTIFQSLSNDEFVFIGDIEDFPGVDHLPCLKTHVQNGKVILEGQPEQLSIGKRTFPPGPGVYVEGEHQTFVIIGAGNVNCLHHYRL